MKRADKHTVVNEVMKGALNYARMLDATDVPGLKDVTISPNSGSFTLTFEDGTSADFWVVVRELR